MKKISWLFCLILSLILWGCSGDTAPDETLVQTKPTGTAEITEEDRIPEGTAVPEESEPTFGTFPTEGSTVDSTDAEKVETTEEEVRYETEKHFLVGSTTSLGLSEINVGTISGGQADVFDLTDPNGWYAYGTSTWGKEVITNLIDGMTVPKTGYYLDGEAVTNETWEHLDMLRAKNSIPAEPELLYGIVENCTDVRIYPTEQRLTVTAVTEAVSTDQDTFDYLQESVLAPGEAVIIMNQSTDGKYYFVQASNTRGWVKKDDVTTCSYATMCNWLNAMDFIIITERKVETATLESTVLLPMGTRLLYFAETESSYYALVPCDADGTQDYVLTSRIGAFDMTAGTNYEPGDLPVKKVLIEKEKCNPGYLYVNEITVMEQAEKMLGMTYGWGGEAGGADCSGMLNALYRCFGVILPRNTGSMAQICGGNKNVVVDVSGMTDAEKELYITSGQAGTLLLMNGHVMLYAGEVEGIPSVIHSVISYTEVGAEAPIKAGACCLTPLSILDGAGNPYLRGIKYVISFY